MKGKEQAGQEGLSRREILMGVGIAAVGLPVAQVATAGTDVPPSNSTVNAASAEDLVDDRFASDSGRHFGSQVIHHGEMKGFNVTPISQDKASPRYQRPGNMIRPRPQPISRS